MSMNRHDGAFWAPLIVRYQQRVHRWEQVEDDGRLLRSLCGLKYGAWDVGQPSETLPKCGLCVKRMKE